jgi:3-methyladenine DNA glycosylase AlkD
MAKTSTSKKAKPKAKTASQKTAAPKKPVSAREPAVSTSVAATVSDILAQLKKLGDDKVRTLNIRNGAGENQFGVKLGDVRNIAKKLKPNHELAMALWKTGILEAQLLTTQLIKARDLSAAEMEAMVKAVKVVQVAEWLHSYVLKDHLDKESLRVKWMTTKDLMAARAAWRLTAGSVAKNPEGIDVVGLLNRIEKEMGKTDPLVQWTMNMCLAEIGINFPQHRERAIAIGEKLGVFRDYPCSAGCTSPFAPIWINEMVRRQG